MSDQLDGEPLTLPQRTSLALHAAFCPMCRRYRRSLEASRAAVKALRDAAAPGEPPTPEG